ncbi:hypothetical protein [Piscirickettsia salmonis]|nr:hypothetical protein [Piscirickettsia salmonis]
MKSNALAILFMLEEDISVTLKEAIIMQLLLVSFVTRQVWLLL